MHIEKLHLRGLTLNVRPETTDVIAATEVLKNRVYEKGGVRIEPGDRWLDAGGNIGSFSALAGSKGVRVIAVEPHPENALMLRSNTCDYDVEVIEAAVAVEAGEASLYLCNGDRNKYRHTLTQIRGRDCITVKVVAAQPLIDQVNAIKFDIEGSEIEILEQCDFSGINKLAMEYHFDRCRSIPRFLAICERLRSFGLHVQTRPMPAAGTYDYYPAMTIVHCVRLLQTP